MASLLLLGLDDASAETISKFAVQAGHSVRRESIRTTLATKPAEDVVLVSGDQSTYRDLISLLKQFGAAPPVVVVSRLGETPAWIEALELGASDFLTAPYTLGKVDGAIRSATAKPKAFSA